MIGVGKSTCISGGDAYVEIRDNKVIVATYAFTIEIEVEKVRNIKLLKGNEAWLKEC